MSFSHYLRHSGTEAVRPDYDDLLENAMGAVAVRATERDTIAASTVSIVKVDSGEGAEFSRGDAILVKSSPYEIRNVLTVSTDDLNLAQDLANAPGTGINLGRNIKYSPVNTGHPTHSIWLYMGNAAAGAVQMMSGGRVTSLSIEMTAGEFINTSYTIDGIGFYYDPIDITATDTAFDFNDGGAKAASITAKTYKDPYQLLDAIVTACNDLSSDTITGSFDDTAGTYTFTSDGVTFELLPATGPNTANEGWSNVGFAADQTGATTYTGSAISKASPQTASFDSADPLVAKDNEVVLSSDSDDITCFEASTITVSLENTKADILSVCSESGKKGAVIQERAWTVEISALLEDHQAKEFKNFRENDKMLFTFNGGTKSGGNWQAGKCVNIHSPTMTIDSFSLDDNDGLVQLNMTLTSYVEGGLGEMYINLL